jgi:serine/threonine-protein kinase
LILDAGTKLGGRYEIRSKLGAGGMGEVYLAEDGKLARKVAIKFLNEEFSRDPDKLRRFMQEAKAASALNHPNIMTVYEIGEMEGKNYIATEFIDGRTLREQQNKALPLTKTLRILAQVAEALSTAHQAGIIHRDIKPDNIMVRSDGYAKVLDFGVAKLLQAPDPAIDTQAATKQLIQTEPGKVIGTVSYMSPEQLRGQNLDARTDIWSLGAVLYEMLAGLPPFSGETSSHVSFSILEREPPPLTQSAPNVPSELQRIVRKALTKDREHRYQTARDLMIDLDNLQRELERQNELEQPSPGGDRAAATIQVITPTSLPTVATEPDLPSGFLGISHKLPLTAAIVLLLVGLIGLGYWSLGRHASSAAAPIESIAVLPFVNESGNNEVEYLSDGMTESLINSLSQLPKLSVKARNTVFRFKGKEIDPQKVAADLSVQAVLSGRVVQRGEDLTLYLSLIEGRSGNQLWGEQYNRKLADLVSLQTEIARDVSQKLRTRLSGVEQQKLTKTFTSNPEAYQLYLKGRYHLSKLTPDELQTAISYFQKAVDLDPNYPLAYVGLANSYRALTLSAELPAREWAPKGKLMAQKAVELDDSLAEAHAVLGVLLYFYDWNWAEAERECKRAVELDPNSADAHQLYNIVLMGIRRFDEAIVEIRRAREIDPLDVLINAREAQTLAYAGRTDEALVQAQKTLEIDPNYWFAHLWAAEAYIAQGKFDEALAAARKSRQILRVGSHATAFIGYALAKSGKEAEARAELNELLKLSKTRYVSPYNLAIIYNGLGDRNETFALLSRGVEERDPKMVLLTLDPKFMNLRDDPRFVALMKRIGLP